MIARGPLPNDLAVGAVDLRPPQRHPSREGGVHLLDGGEGPARTWSRTMPTCRSPRPLPWGR